MFHKATSIWVVGSFSIQYEATVACSSCNSGWGCGARQDQMTIMMITMVFDGCHLWNRTWFNNHKNITFKQQPQNEETGLAESKYVCFFIINKILAHLARGTFYPCKNILAFERDKRGASLNRTSATEKRAALIYGRGSSRTIHLRLPAFSFRMI